MSAEFALLNMSSAKLSAYLQEQPEFINDVVMITKLWKLNHVDSHFPGPKWCLYKLVELIAVKCGQDEIERANDFNSKPSITQAFLQVLRILSKDLEDVQIVFDGSQPHKFQEEKDSSCKAINPHINYFNHYPPQVVLAEWLLSQRRAKTSLRRFNRFKHTEADLNSAELCKDLLGIKERKEESDLDFEMDTFDIEDKEVPVHFSKLSFWYLILIWLTAFFIILFFDIPFYRLLLYCALLPFSVYVGRNYVWFSFMMIFVFWMLRSSR